MDALAPREIRYIKLGAGGAWARPCFERGEIWFGYPMVPHEPCLAGDWEAITRLLVEIEGKTPGKAKDQTREIRDFYTLGSECLWVTFAEGHLWWAFAAAEVHWLGPGDETRPSRMRKTLDGWRRTDLAGRRLRIDALSSRLTRVRAYQQTICRVQAEGYLLRRINGTEEPVVGRAREARAALVEIAREMVEALHWADFETLVDLIFARTGWQRVSRVGGTQADIDLILEQPATGERAGVQVKSKAGQAEIDRFIEHCERSGAYDHRFFVCHSSKGTFAAGEDTRLHLWAGERLAEAAVTAGLFDWLVERSG